LVGVRFAINFYLETTKTAMGINFGAHKAALLLVIALCLLFGQKILNGSSEINPAF